MEVSASVRPLTRRISRSAASSKSSWRSSGISKRILDEGILPGIDVRLLRNHHRVGAFGQRRGPRDGYGLRGAGLHAFAREPIGRSEAPAAVGETRMPRPERLVFRKRADFAVFCGEIAQADVHHASVGKGRAARLRRIERQAAHSCISPMTPETIGGGTTFLELTERGTECPRAIRCLRTRRPDSAPAPE